MNTVKNKRKQIILNYFGCAFIFILISITPVSAGLISDFLGKVGNFVSTEALNGLVAWLTELYMGMISVSAFAFTACFGPDTTLFDTFIGTAAYNDFPFVGMVMMLIIYVMMMIFCAFGSINLSDTKDTPWSLTGRLVLGFVLMLYSSNITQIFFDEGLKIYKKIWNSTSSDVNQAIQNLSFPVAKCASVVTEANLNPVLVVDDIFAIVLAYILGVIFLVQVVKFVFEIVERYVVACFLYYIFPLPLSTIVAKNSSGIFKKYMQMLIIQIIMLWMNAYFMRIIFSMPIRLADSELQQGVGGVVMFYLLLFGFMKIARKIDNYAYTMGLSVAVTGGNVLDACRGAGMTMLAMSRGLSNGVRSMGGLATAAGAAMGNAGVMQAGMKLSSLANAGTGRGVDASMAGAIKEASMRGTTDSIAKNIRPEQIDQSMVTAARFGDFRANNGLNSLNDDTKAALVNKAFGAGACPEGSSMSNIKFDLRGGFTADFTDANGSTTTMSVSPTANNRTIGSFTDPEGNGFYFNPIKADNASMATYSFDPKNPESLHQAESHFGQSFSSLGSLRNDVNAVRKAENGDLLFYGANKDGENGVLARMDSAGKVAHNDRAFTLSPKTLGNLSSFSGFSDLRMKDNGNGSVSVYGKNTKKEGSPVEMATLYNKANYSREEAQQANGGGSVTSISGGASSGSWWCVKSNIPKKSESVAEIQNAHEKLPTLTNYDAAGNLSGYSTIEVQPFYGGISDATSINTNNVNVITTQTNNVSNDSATSYSDDYSSYNEDYEMGSDVDASDMSNTQDYSDLALFDATIKDDDYYADYEE